MSGSRLKPKEVETYMEYRAQGYTQKVAATKSGFSIRTAKRIEAHAKQPVPLKKSEERKNPKDPFKDVWETEAVPLLEKNPKLQALTLLQYVQDAHPGQYPDNLLRTLQRRVQAWRALFGPEKEVMFLQEHPPGYQSLSDFTDANDLNVTIKSTPFSHRLYHFWMAFSTWEYATVVMGGESFSALSEGLQGALWLLGAVPKTHRTDSLSAAYKNLSKNASEDFTKSYEAVCEQYGMIPTRNNKGVKHENGSVESSHRHLKSRMDQALMIRGSRDFDSVADYKAFLCQCINRHNQGIRNLVDEEMKYLKPLPKVKVGAFELEIVRVTSSSTATIRQVRYSVPSRLIGINLKCHLYDDRIECFVGSTPVITLERLRWKKGTRPRKINYRHVVEWLARKPHSFRNYIYREDLFLTPAFKTTWERYKEQLDERTACRAYVALLRLSAEHGEETISCHLEKLLSLGSLPTPAVLGDLLPKKQSSQVTVKVDQRELKAYDQLLNNKENL